MSKQNVNGRYQRQGKRVIYELNSVDGRTVTLAHPTGCPDRDKRLALLLAGQVSHEQSEAFQAELRRMATMPAKKFINGRHTADRKTGEK